MTPGVVRDLEDIAVVADHWRVVVEMAECGGIDLPIGKLLDALREIVSKADKAADAAAAPGARSHPAEPDPRLCCKFHPATPATRVAPQHDGGDEDVPAVWVPVCEEHVADWYEDHEDDRLPMFDLPA